MSSHHIVREKQEPALLVLGLDSFSTELLGQLLEWSPTVIATPYTAEMLDNYGIKIDWVIADHWDASIQSDIKQMSPGNDSPMATALKYLVTHGYSSVNIVTDDLDLKDYLFYADKINLVIFHGNQKIYAVNSGFSKWKTAGETIEVLTHHHDIHLGGLEPIGNQCFKTTHDGFFSLQFEHPFLFIAEAI